MHRIRELRQLIHLVEQSSITELDLKNENMSVILKKTSVSNVQPKQVISTQELPIEKTLIEHGEHHKGNSVEKDLENREGKESLQQIVSRWVGIFTTKSEEDTLSSVHIGDQIKEGQTLAHCLVGGLHLSHEIKADISGEIVDILADEGQVIEYGQALFLIKT